MSLIEKIKNDIMISRKNKDSEKLLILTTFLSEAEKVGKDKGNRESTDGEVVATLKKFINNIDQSIEVFGDNNDRIQKYEFEKNILEYYLPKQLSEAELMAVIHDLVSSLPEKNVKMMGKVMSELKQKHEGLYDGKIASKIVKDILS